MSLYSAPPNPKITEEGFDDWCTQNDLFSTFPPICEIYCSFHLA